jgi:hypothetical protein
MLRMTDLAPCMSTAAITSNFNGTAIPAGAYLWFNSVFKLSGAGQSAQTTIYFSNEQIQFTAEGIAYMLPVPNAQVTFSPTATTASSTFDSVSNTWITTVPYGLSGNTFLSGLAFSVPAGGLPAGINPVTWSGTFGTDTPGVTVHWQWGAAVYSLLSTDYTTLGVKASDDSHTGNADHAGTPEQYKALVTGGARGGGGANYTGSYSGTGSVNNVCTQPPPPPPCLGTNCGAGISFTVHRETHQRLAWHAHNQAPH